MLLLWPGCECCVQCLQLQDAADVYCGMYDGVVLIPSAGTYVIAPGFKNCCNLAAVLVCTDWLPVAMQGSCAAHHSPGSRLCHW